jgi:ubiquinone biosynthesis protein UbiJ
MRAPWLMLAEHRLNQCLDFESASELRELLEQQSLWIVVSETGLSITLSINSHKVSLSHQAPSSYSAKISGKLYNLLNLIKNPGKRQAGILLEGDLAILEGFSKLMALSSQNWEELLSPYLGDTLGYHVSKGLKRLATYGKERGQAFSLDFRDYVQEEIKLLPTQVEVLGWMDEVDSLNLKTERLEARLKKTTEKIVKI